MDQCLNPAWQMPSCHEQPVPELAVFWYRTPQNIICAHNTATSEQVTAFKQLTSEEKLAPAVSFTEQHFSLQLLPYRPGRRKESVLNDTPLIATSGYLHFYPKHIYTFLPLPL